MNNVTIQVSPVKTVFIAAGVIALGLGGLTFHISDVVKTTMFLSGVEDFLYSFLTFGSRPMWLAEIRNYGYFWLGLGMILTLVGLFARLTPDDEESAKQAAYREEIINSAKSMLTPEQNRALNDDVFKDIGNKIKSVFAPVKLAPRAKPATKRSAAKKPVRIEPVLEPVVEPSVKKVAKPAAKRVAKTTKPTAFTNLIDSFVETPKK